MKNLTWVILVVAVTVPAHRSSGQQAATVAPLKTAGSADLATGKRIFDSQCAWCHGADGAGGNGPMLQRATLRHAANDKSLVEIVRNGVPGTEMPSFVSALTERAAWQTAAYVRSLGRVAVRPVPGDPRKGATLYESAGCGSCHMIAGQGRAIGPELTAIGALRGPSHLRESIVNPAATHPPGFLVVRATTAAGAEIRGVRLNEDVFWIHIRDSGGTVHVLEKSQLLKLDRELDATLMPSYGSRFSESELNDLVAYLANLRGTS